MPKLIHLLLTLIAQATEEELVLYIECLKAENQILRTNLPSTSALTLRPTTLPMPLVLDRAWHPVLQSRVAAIQAALRHKCLRGD